MNINLNTIKDRIKNPLFRLALVGFVYQMLRQSGIEIDEQSFRTGADIISWLFVGSGVYASFDTTPNNDNQDAPPPSEE
jgi:hypothetical protein